MGSLENESEFTIVLLEDGQDYFVDRCVLSCSVLYMCSLLLLTRRNERKQRPKSKSKKAEDSMADNFPDFFSPWWKPHDKNERRSLRHPDADTTTWKQFMEPIGYPSQVPYDPDPRAMEPMPVWTANVPEYLHPMASPAISSAYSVYSSASSISPWKSYMSSPMGYYSGYSEPISLPASPYVVFENPIFVDETGYPYPPS